LHPRIVARAALPILIVGEAGVLALAVQHPFDQSVVLRFESIGLAVFALAVGALVVAELPARLARWVILGGAVAFSVIAVTRPASHSDDVFRYIWDAKVQLAGIDPYRYAPADPHLAAERDSYLFPSASSCGHYQIPTGCTQINLPTQHTIYPPVAQAAFVLIRLASFGGHGNQFPYQLAASIGALLITVLLLRLRRDQSLWPIALWAWCPVTVLELSSNAHIDWLGVVFAIGALLLYQHRRPLLAGLLLGAGIATKIYPALVGVAMVKRHPQVVACSAIALIGLSYLPHLFAVGTHVVGYLPTYISAGGYGNGRQYRLLAAVLPASITTLVAVAVLIIAALWIMRRTDPNVPQQGALLMAGITALVTTPVLPWYTLLLLALAAACDRPEWLGVAVAPTFVYLLAGSGHASRHNATYLYLAAFVILLLGTAARRQVQRSGRTTRPAAAVGGQSLRHERSGHGTRAS
jgi:hypothetical protein